MRNEKDRHPVYELHPDLRSTCMSVFINRSDCYPLQLDKGSYVTVKRSLMPEMVTAHFKGVVTIGTYALDSESRAKWLCFDGDSEEQFSSLIKLARQLEQQQIRGYLEQSRRGGHFWLFTPPMQGKNIRQFGKQLIRDHGLDEKIELYPKQDRLTTGTGSLVRLPFGIHRKTGKRYYFTTPEGEPLAPTIREQIAILAHPQQIPQSFIDHHLAQVPEPKSPSPTPHFADLKRGSGQTLSEVIRSTVSVHQLVSQYVQLDQHGKGLCPFHDDLQQSFQVNIQGNYWNCYAGCGGGSVIDFWMKWRETHGQDGSFKETIKELRGMVL